MGNKQTPHLFRCVPKLDDGGEIIELIPVITCKSPYEVGELESRVKANAIIHQRRQKRAQEAQEAERLANIAKEEKAALARQFSLLKFVVTWQHFYIHGGCDFVGFDTLIDRVRNTNGEKRVTFIQDCLNSVGMDEFKKFFNDLEGGIN